MKGEKLMKEKAQEMNIGQVLELSSAITRAIPRDLPPDIAQMWIANSAALKQALSIMLMQHENKKDLTFSNEFLKLISRGYTLTLDFQKGKQNLADRCSFFASQEFITNEKNEATLASEVEVFELLKTCTANEFFGSLGANLNKFCLTESQILNFYSKHHGWFAVGGPTFFLLKQRSGNFFSVRFILGRGVSVYASNLKDEQVWDSNQSIRVVLPKLT